MRTYKTTGVVLRHYNFAESDRVVLLYTAGMGKVRAVAKGVRSMKSKTASSLEIFSHADLLLYKKEHGELYTVTGSGTIDGYAGLREDLDNFASASYVVELVDKSSEENEPNAEIFSLLLGTFSRIPSGDGEIERWIFAVKLMALSGYKLCMDMCALCGKGVPQKGEGAPFNPSRGGLLCRDCGMKNKEAMNVGWRAIECFEMLEQADMKSKERFEIGAGERKEIDGMVRMYLADHIRGELKTEKFIKKIKENN